MKPTKKLRTPKKVQDALNCIDYKNFLTEPINPTKSTVEYYTERLDALDRQFNRFQDETAGRIKTLQNFKYQAIERMKMLYWGLMIVLGAALMGILL